MARSFKTVVSVDELASASSEAIRTKVDGDTQSRLSIDAGGKVTWGSGAATGDVNLYRDAADALKTDDTLEAAAGLITSTSAGAPTATIADGALAVDTTNDAFYFRSGAAWQQVTGGGGSITTSDTAPVSPDAGDLWYETDTGRTLVYYADGTSSQWVEVGASASVTSRLVLQDDDADTKVQVEEGTDDDTIRFDTLGVERMVIKSDGKVGIGTTAPAAPLDVRGQIMAHGDAAVYEGVNVGVVNIHGGVADTILDWGEGLVFTSGAGGAGNWTHGGIVGVGQSGFNGDLVFGTDGDGSQNTTGITEKMRITHDGKVGIGTNAPTYPLHVQSDTHPQLFIQAATNADAVIRSGSGPSWVNNFHQIRFNHYAVASGHGPDNKINFEVNGGTEATPTTRMTINGDGNVGIGTTTPNHSLSFGSPSNGTRSLALWENGTAFYGLGNDTNRLAFYASNAAGTAERMVLTSDGNVGIGTTAPVRRLTVESDLCVATGNTAYLWQTNTTNTNLQLWSKTASGDTGWGQRVYMTQSATSWAAGSDRRLKRDIVDHDGDLAEVLGLRVRSYNFNDDAADQPARYGFITDEVPASLGHLVTGEAGAVTIDEETGEEKPDPQGLFYTDLVPHLVGAIQELSAQNASLVVRIETLETA